MGKGNYFSISCSKKLTQCDPYIGLNTDTTSILFFFKETLLANLEDKLLGTPDKSSKSFSFSRKKKV